VERSKAHRGAGSERLVSWLVGWLGARGSRRGARGEKPGALVALVALVGGRRAGGQTGGIGFPWFLGKGGLLPIFPSSRLPSLQPPAPCPLPTNLPTLWPYPSGCGKGGTGRLGKCVLSPRETGLTYGDEGSFPHGCPLRPPLSRGAGGNDKTRAP